MRKANKENKSQSQRDEEEEFLIKTLVGCSCIMTGITIATLLLIWLFT